MGTSPMRFPESLPLPPRSHFQLNGTAHGKHGTPRIRPQAQFRERQGEAVQGRDQKGSRLL